MMREWNVIVAHRVDDVIALDGEECTRLYDQGRGTQEKDPNTPSRAREGVISIPTKNLEHA